MRSESKISGGIEKAIRGNEAMAHLRLLPSSEQGAIYFGLMSVTALSGGQIQAIRR